MDTVNINIVPILKEISIRFHCPMKLPSSIHYSLFQFILKVLT